MTAVASAARSGFETAIAVPPGYQSFEVQALDAGGAGDRSYPGRSRGRVDN